MTTIYGENGFFYAADTEWNKKVGQFGFRVIAGLGIDSGDHLYVLARQTPFISILNNTGDMLGHWGEGVFSRPHGLTLSRDGSIYCVDDGLHAVFVFNQSHELIKTIGAPGVPSDSGVIGRDWRTVKHGAPPFNCPTSLAFGETNDFYVTDGYGNARVHHFTKDGVLIDSFGEPGTAPGSFNLPHGIAVYNNHLYVADRENHRIQIFNLEGKYIDEWTGFHRPAGIFVVNENYFFIAECRRASDFDESPSQITILDITGKKLAVINKKDSIGYNPNVGHHTAHSLVVDSKGNIYIGEVGKNFPEGYCGLKRFCPVQS